MYCSVRHFKYRTRENSNWYLKYSISYFTVEYFKYSTAAYKFLHDRSLTDRPASGEGVTRDP